MRPAVAARRARGAGGCGWAAARLSSQCGARLALMAPMMRVDAIAAVQQRQQHGLELDAMAGVDAALDGEWATAPPARRGSTAAAPERARSASLQPSRKLVPRSSVAEQLAQPGAGQPDTGKSPASIALQHEGLRQDAGDARRLDLEPPGRDAACADLVPVADRGSVGFAASCRSRPLCPCGLCELASSRYVAAPVSKRDATTSRPAGRSGREHHSCHRLGAATRRARGGQARLPLGLSAPGSGV